MLGSPQREHLQEFEVLGNAGFDSKRAGARLLAPEGGTEIDVIGHKMYLAVTRCDFTAGPMIAARALEITPIHHPLCFGFILQARQVALCRSRKDSLYSPSPSMGCLFSLPRGLCQTGPDPSSFILKCLPTAGNATGLMGNSPGAHRDDHTTVKTMGGRGLNNVPFQERHQGRRRRWRASVKGGRVESLQLS